MAHCIGMANPDLEAEVSFDVICQFLAQNFISPRSGAELGLLLMLPLLDGPYPESVH